MKDIMGLMKKAGEMQAKMQEMQEEAANAEVVGTAGGGLVTVTLSGKGEMRGLKVDPSLLKEEEAEIMEDLILAAHNDAKGKSEAAMQEKMQEMTAGLPLPPGMKLPF
ncbi:MAG: YbaB/EbfC family nucleoid-associated protein [Hyphomicrobiales bacterium]